MQVFLGVCSRYDCWQNSFGIIELIAMTDNNLNTYLQFEEVVERGFLPQTSHPSSYQRDFSSLYLSNIEKGNELQSC